MASEQRQITVCPICDNSEIRKRKTTHDYFCKKCNGTFIVPATRARKREPVKFSQGGVSGVAAV